LIPINIGWSLCKEITMRKPCIKSATVLVTLNLIAVFYLNFSQDLNFPAQFLVLPWLVIQSLFVLSIINSNSGENQ
jgi:hypothetical protein